METARAHPSPPPPHTHTHTNTHTHMVYTNMYHNANIILAEHTMGHEAKTTVFLVKTQLH
jgi:hypothetical protein